ncbi:MAG: AAA family ATPase [Gammaproteobacteria bacterium]
MYYDYFGLKQAPFKITPDTRLFFPGGNRGAVLDALLYAIVSGEGIVKVVGEVGSGKTMLCRMLEQELPASVEIVYLANPSLAPENIVYAIAFELKLTITPDDSRLKVMNLLQEYLLQRHAENRQVVVFIEEAQSMPIETLEEIRLLSNLETQQNKLLQIVIFGQPELNQLIANKKIRQLKERITYSFQLSPFKKADIKDYLNARLRACGYRAGEVFDSSAIKTVEYFSQGLVRRVNILADKAMLAAYAGNTNRVRSKHVRLAARDSEFVSGWRRFNITSTALVLLLLAVMLWFFQQAGVTLSVPVAGVNGDSRNDTETRSAPIGKTVSGSGVGPVIYHAELDASEIPAEADAEIITDDVQSVDEPVPVSDFTHEDMPAHEVIYFDQNEGSRAVVTEAGPEEAGQEYDEIVEDVDGVAPAYIGEGAGTSVTVDNTEESQDKPYDNASFETDTDVSGQLLGLSKLFESQDFEDSHYLNDESAMLQQLKTLPPEVAINGDVVSEGHTCKLCVSIIYRPLTSHDNL